MRRQWILYLLLLALAVSVGIGTANLMWGKRPHVAEEHRYGGKRPTEEQADGVWYPLEVSTGEGEDAA